MRDTRADVLSALPIPLQIKSHSTMSTKYVKLDESRDIIAEAIRSILEEGGDGNFAIVKADEAKNYYAQFAAARGEDGIYAEVVGNDFLSRDSSLTVSQLDELSNRGWKPSESGNLSREWDQLSSEEDRLKVADHIISIFEDVYEVSIDKKISVDVTLE